MSTTAEKVAVMQAAINGEKTEWRKRGREDAWVTSHEDNLIWNWETNEYRVKRTPREFYIATHPNITRVYQIIPGEDETPKTIKDLIRVREILD